MFRQPALPYAAALLSLALAVPATLVAAQSDLKTTRDNLKQLWDSLESVQFRCEEFNADKVGRPERTKGFTRYDLILGSGGRRSVTVTAVRPEGEKVVMNFREDGRRKVGIDLLPGKSDVVDKVYVSNQRDTHNDYESVMCPPLWIITPGGKPLYSHLDAGGILDFRSGGGYPVLTFNHKGKNVRCELDPRHDWLPRRVVIEGFSDLVVSSFAFENGRYFPERGIQTYTFKQKDNVSAFVVDGLRINRPVSESNFKAPPLSEGTLIVDKNADKAVIKGGLEARARLTGEEYVTVRSTQDATGSIEASTDPERFPWGRVLVVLFALSLLVIGVITLRKSRS
jgi:hypothetical protein